jgi:hypothetical protein
MDIIIWIPAAIWIYKDSKEEKMPAAWLWAILVLIARYQGIIILLLIRHVLDREILPLTPNKGVVADAAKDSAPPPPEPLNR